MSKLKHIGVLPDRIEIYQVVKGSSASGAPIETNQLFKTCWANKEDVSGKEEEDGKVYFLISKRFYINYDARLVTGDAEKMVVKYKDQYYNITAVLEYVPKRYLVLNTVKDV